MNNPATRLISFIVALRPQANVTPIVAWRQAIGADEHLSELAIMSQYLKMFQLPDLISERIRTLEDLSADLYLGWMPEFTNACKNLNWNSNLNQFLHGVPESLLIPIKFCEDALSKRLPEPAILPDQISDLQTKASALFADLATADLPSDLRSYLGHHIYLIISALDDYRFFGVPRIEDAVNTAVGSMVTNPAAATASAKTDVGKRFIHLLAAVALAIKLGTALVQLTERVEHLLGFPTESAETKDSGPQ